jgi:F-type H+-transporting ATPase subunit epsilon
MHAPLVTTLKCGELRYTKGSETDHMAVGEGLVEVTGDHARVLTDMAIGVEDIDEKAVEEALERAHKALSALDDGEQQEEVAAVMATIQRTMAQLHVKRRRL